MAVALFAVLLVHQAAARLPVFRLGLVMRLRAASFVCQRQISVVAQDKIADTAFMASDVLLNL